MSVCHHCQRKHEGCHAACAEHITETLVNDLINMEKRRENLKQQNAKSLVIRRWEKNNHRKARQM